MTVQEAVEAPRWRHRQIGGESTVPHGVDDVLVLEERFPQATRDALASLGHTASAHFKAMITGYEDVEEAGASD